MNAGRRDLIKRMARECALAETSKAAETVAKAVTKITKAEPVNESETRG